MFTQAAPSAQAECFHRPEDRARPGPLRAPNSQSFRPKSALNAVGCLSVQRLLPPPRTSPPGDRRCPPAALRPHKIVARGFMRFRAPSSRRPRNKADDSANRRSGGTCPAQDFRCRTLFSPCKRESPGTPLPSPPHERRRAADDSVALLRRAAGPPASVLLFRQIIPQRLFPRLRAEGQRQLVGVQGGKRQRFHEVHGLRRSNDHAHHAGILKHHTKGR